MSKKNRSPVVEISQQILEAVDLHNEMISVNRSHFIKLLKSIEWNLLMGVSKTDSVHIWQALGYSRGALRMLGHDETIGQ